MINYEALEQSIKASGKSYKHLAERLGVSPVTFYNKRTGLTQFSASQLIKLLDELNANDDERLKIFRTNSD